MNFNPINFINNFHYLVSGMISIFIVIGIIIIVTSVLNKCFSKKSN